MLLTNVMNIVDRPAVFHGDITLFLAKYMTYIIPKLFRIKVTYTLLHVNVSAVCVICHFHNIGELYLSLD